MEHGVMTENAAAVNKHKSSAAFSSVAAAVFLTTMKLVVGIITGSLGILAEAAHSGLDLVAALVTFIAVRISGKPADSEHTYGHGKVENLSALFEAVLLVVTSIWIIYEAVQRLFFKSVVVEASTWAFLVMAVSIIIDFTRSRMLLRVAKQYNSQALEADGLHFSTDIWSSSVVIAGLVLVRLSSIFTGLSFLKQADAVAAMGVAVIVLYVAGEMAWRTITVLLDAVPSNLQDEISGKVRQLPQVVDIKQLRLRQSGPESFVDLTVYIPSGVTIEEAHGVASQIESIVQGVIKGADVVVHVEPAGNTVNGHDDLVAALHDAAILLNLNIHGVRILQINEGYDVEVHAEMPGNLNLAQAHDIISRFEDEVRKVNPAVDDIITHIEPANAVNHNHNGQEDAFESSSQSLAVEAEKLAKDLFGADSCHKVHVHTLNGRASIVMHCVLPADINLTQAHNISEALEDVLRQRYPSLDRVLIHTEPLQK